MVNLKKYVPKCYKEIRELNIIYELESEQLSEVERQAIQLHNNCFVQTCDSDTLVMWEQLLNIKRVMTDDLETRRKKVLFTILIQPPFTEIFLKMLLSNYVKDYRLDIDSINCIVTLFIIENNLSLANYIKQLLIPIIPAHMSLVVVVGQEYDIEIKQVVGVATSISNIYDVYIRRENG